MAAVDPVDQTDLGRKSSSEVAEMQKKYQQAQSNFDALKALAQRGEFPLANQGWIFSCSRAEMRANFSGSIGRVRRVAKEV